MLRSVARLLAATLLLASLGAISAAPVGAGGGCHGADGTVHTEGDATVVRMGPCSFSPTVVHVPVGTQVRFLNTAEVEHMVVGEAQSWGAPDVVAPGAELGRAFATKGVYPYSCPLHPGMVGAVVVGGGDAAAVQPAAAAAGSSNAAAQPGAAAPAGPETAASSGLLPAAVILGASVLVLAVVGGALLWRRHGARPLASPEA